MWSSDLGLRVVFGGLVLLLLVMQYRLWVGNGSVAEVVALKDAITAQRRENHKLDERNQALEAEVRDLKTAVDAIEERARLELGMIREGEVFYRVVEPEPTPSGKAGANP